MLKDWVPHLFRYAEGQLLQGLTVQQLQRAVSSLTVITALLTVTLAISIIAYLIEYHFSDKHTEKVKIKRKQKLDKLALKNNCEWNRYGTLEKTYGITYCPYCAEYYEKLNPLKQIPGGFDLCTYCGNKYPRRQTQKEFTRGY